MTTDTRTLPARSALTVRAATDADLPAVAEIYAEGVADGTANSDLSPMTAERLAEWWAEHSGRFGAWVAEVDGQVAGWVALSPYDHKPCFRLSAYSSTYVRRSHRGQGIARRLREHLIEEARRRGFHSIVNRILATNHGSIALTLELGFEDIGTARGLAVKDGELVDCRFFQLILDPPEPGS